MSCGQAEQPWAPDPRTPYAILVSVAPLLKLAPKWRGFLARVICEEDLKVLRAHEHTGRPLGEEAFLATLEQKLGRIVRRQKPGPKGSPPR